MVDSIQPGPSQQVPSCERVSRGGTVASLFDPRVVIADWLVSSLVGLHYLSGPLVRAKGRSAFGGSPPFGGKEGAKSRGQGGQAGQPPQVLS